MCVFCCCLCLLLIASPPPVLGKTGNQTTYRCNSLATLPQGNHDNNDHNRHHGHVIISYIVVIAVIIITTIITAIAVTAAMTLIKGIKIILIITTTIDHSHHGDHCLRGDWGYRVTTVITVMTVIITVIMIAAVTIITITTVAPCTTLFSFSSSSFVFSKLFFFYFLQSFPPQKIPSSVIIFFQLSAIFRRLLQGRKHPALSQHALHFHIFCMKKKKHKTSFFNKLMKLSVYFHLYRAAPRWRRLIAECG